MFSFSCGDVCIIRLVHDSDELLFQLRANCWTNFHGNQETVYCVGSGCNGWSYNSEYPFFAFIIF